MEVKIHLEKIDQGNLIKAQIYLKPLIITSMSNSWKASLQQVIQNWMTAVLGLLKSGKLRLRRTSDRGDLSSMSDRTGRPVGDRTGRPVEQRNQEAQIRTLLNKQKEQILAECQVQQRDQQLLEGQLLQQILELREAHQRSLTEMEEFRKFQSSTFDTIARRKLVEDQNTILELTGKIQELQNEINCMNDSKDCQDAESIRSGKSHVTSRPV